MKSLEFNKKIKKSGKPVELSGVDYKNIPHNEETKEEQERINKNDPGVSIKTGEAFKYIPKEEIAEYNGDAEELLAEKIDNLSNEGFEEEFLELDETTEEEIEKQKKEIEERPINFFQDNTDVAHMGPDFESKKLEDELFEQELNLLKKEAFLGKEDLDSSLPYFLSKSKFLRKIINGYYDYRKEKRRQNTGSEKDNLKTMPDSKKEKMARGNLREINRDNKNYEDRFTLDEEEELDRIIGDNYIPEFKENVGPELVSLQEEEEVKINKQIFDDFRVGELEKTEKRERNIA